MSEKIPIAHFVGEEIPTDWRLRLADEDGEDGDEELYETPEEITGMLGFDPKELS